MWMIKKLNATTRHRTPKHFNHLTKEPVQYYSSWTINEVENSGMAKQSQEHSLAIQIANMPDRYTQPQSSPASL